MSAKDEKRENQDLKPRLAALSKKSAGEPASQAVTPLPEKEPSHIRLGNGTLLYGIRYRRRAFGCD